MESSPTSHPVLRRAAWSVVLVSLLPITMGAFVTTLGAGMAFLDWPSSDGHHMLLYPWLKDLSDADRFTEHGHRLAGVLIGVCSIVLFGVSLRFDRRVWVRCFAGVILLSVIAQGLLGGARVLLDRQLLAMLHSITASLFFCLCVMFLTLTGTRWQKLRAERDDGISLMSFGILLILPLVVFGQYILGSSFRHLHTMLDEHLVGAVIVSVLSTYAVVVLLRSGSPSLRHMALLLLFALMFQVLLGLGSFVTSLGFKPYGVVAIRGSWPQTIVCSLHTVGGMLLLGASVVTAATAVRLQRIGALTNVCLTAPLPIPRGSEGGMR